jgi:O-antigen/teichoic acid export membrane protein
MDILSTLKGEYSRTLILILIPGGIALLPIADIFYVLFFKDQKEYIGYFSVLVFLVLFPKILVPGLKYSWIAFIALSIEAIEETSNINLLT